MISYILCIGFFYVPGLRNHCLLCRLVLRVDQEGEFLPTGPEVRLITPLFDNRTSCTRWIIVLYLQIWYFLFLNRRVSGFRIREAALPPAVLGVHVGKWNLSASPPADAQHWGAPSVSGPHSEDGGDQVRPSDYMGGLCIFLTSFQSCFYIL